MAGETLTWIDLSSISHPFDDSIGILALDGEQGLTMPPIALLDQRTPGRAGSRVRYIDVLPRPVTIPLQFHASSESALRTLIKSATSWFKPAAGTPGTVRATEPDGTTQRDLFCYYQGGLEGDGKNRTPGGHVFAVQLLASDDPLWNDVNATVTSYTNTQMGSPISITNNGDWECWPIWTVNGPFVNLVMTNTTTGKKTDLTNNGGISIANGHSIVIDSLKGTIILDGTTSELGLLTPDSVPWPLATGANSITFSYTGGVNGQTSAQVSYKQRWFSY
jgi:hypothetical protein